MVRRRERVASRSAPVRALRVPAASGTLHVTETIREVGTVAGSSTRSRVRKHRQALRRAGLRPVQIWVPDTRRPDFPEQCRRQSLLTARADRADESLFEFLDEALSDIGGWSG